MNFANNTAGAITTLAIVVTAASGTKVYDGTTTTTATPSITSGSLAPGDTAAFSEAFTIKNAGPGRTLKPAGSVSDGNGGANYAVTLVNNTTGQITPLPITVTAAAATKVYDGATSSAVAPAISGGSLASGDTAAFSETYNNKNVGAGKTLTPGGSVADGNGGANYTVSLVASTSGSITVRPITVTAATNTKTYDGTTTAAATPTITGGLGAGDTAAFHETYDNANVGSGKTLTPAGSVNDGNGGANYTVSFAANTTGEIVTQLNDPYVSLSDGIGASFTAGQGTWVQVPIRLDNLQDGSGDVGLRNATVEVSFSSTAYLAGAPSGAKEVGTSNNTVTITTQSRTTSWLARRSPSPA